MTNIHTANIIFTNIILMAGKHNIPKGMMHSKCRLRLAFLMTMFKTALNKNLIPHIWKLAYIFHIQNPNKDIDKGTLYISLLSVIAKTLERSLLPYITASIPNTPMQHRYKAQHSTVTALHTLINTVAKGFNLLFFNIRFIEINKTIYMIAESERHKEYS